MSAAASTLREEVADAQMDENNEEVLPADELTSESIAALPDGQRQDLLVATPS